MAKPLLQIRVQEVENIIQSDTHPTKAPGYYLITGKLLKELPRKGLRAITPIYNAIFRLEYFPCHWKIGQIIMIAKPGKNPSEVTSYRPISLLPPLSTRKILEEIILKRLTPTLAVNKVIPSHHFGFRPKHGTIQQVHRIIHRTIQQVHRIIHGTIQQVHRIIHRINNDLENKRYCTAAFLDISQAFDKVWHTGLFLLLKQALGHPEYTVLRSYLKNRMFQVRHQEEHTLLHPIHAGVPQGSILGPILYTIFTAALPEAEQTLTATYADDTAILAYHEDPIFDTSYLQTHRHRLEQWLEKWHICAESKSTQVTFILRREDCPPVYLNGRPIPQNDAVKYLGLHLDRRLTCRTHISCQKETIRPLNFIQMNVLDY
jgi:hypothetical protein